MASFRKVLFWAHLTTAAIGGVVILVMSATGVLMAYERQVVDWADSRGLAVTRGERLPVETLVERARQAKPDAAPVAVTIDADPTEPVSVSYPGGRALLLDPVTGASLGEGATGVRGFFRTVEDLHRWLAASGENRAVGRAITGACNLGFLFVVVSGIYLWMPRKWTKPALRNGLWFRRRLSGRARDFNWHNVIGFWACVPLFVVVLSGVVMSYGWANDLVYRAAGEAPPPPRTGPPGGPGGPGGRDAKVSSVGLDPLVARAERQVDGWRTINVQLPPADDAPVTFSIDAGSGGQPSLRGSLTLDRATGDVRKWEPGSAGSPGRRARVFLRFAHTGEVFGLVGQTVAGLASLGAVVLVWTGFALAWRRFRAWRARRVRGTASASDPAVAER